ncbi:phosphatase 1 regulatory subunit 7 protein-like protein, partial [Umbelopsis sp. PMI_123]
LFLVSNKLSSVDGLQDLTQLTYLELGANRFRSIENFDTFVNLEQLWLGKNKITKLEVRQKNYSFVIGSNLSSLKHLRLLSLQSNRIAKLEGLEELHNLEELYVSHNLLEKIEGLENNIKLRTLDVAANRITKLENISHLSLLEEFWANSNLLPTETFNDLEKQLKDKTHLETVYLEGNPMQKENRATYRNKIRLALPQIKQIDATFSGKANETIDRYVTMG